jgi:hypothetical protein
MPDHLHVTGAEHQTPGNQTTEHPAKISEIDAKLAAFVAKQRAASINGLRQLADFLERHPSVELPYTMGGAVFVELEEARAFMAAAPGGWAKDDAGNYWGYRKNFPGRVEYNVYVSREQLCQKVQIGTRHVDTVEAHEEPIYKWECAPVDELPTS